MALTDDIRLIKGRLTRFEKRVKSLEKTIEELKQEIMKKDFEEIQDLNAKINKP